MKIKNILSVSDTRQFAEVDGKLKAISGSGERNSCALCGALHEIHAVVEFDNGSSAIVGVACAKKNSPVALKRHALFEKMKPLMDRRAELLNVYHEDCVGSEYVRGRELIYRPHGWSLEKDMEFKIQACSFEEYCATKWNHGREIADCKKKIEKIQQKINELS